MTFCRLLFSMCAALIATAATAQSPKLPRRPADVDAALVAMPIAAPVADGHRIEVVDRDSDEPVQGADVWIVEESKLAPFRPQLREVQQSFARDEDGYHKLVAAWFGTHHRAGTDGALNVAPEGPATILSISGDRIAVATVRRWPDDDLVLKLVEKRCVEVTVTDSKGRPAAQVPVSFGMLHEYGDHSSFNGFQPVVTDGRGRARLPFERLPPNRVAVQVDVLMPEVQRAKIEFDAEGRQKQPVAFQLPPCGMVRVLLYDEQEHPLAAMTSVELGIVGGTDQAGRGRPSQFAADGALFRWVALGHQIEATVGVRGLDGGLRQKQAGPTREGELVVVGVRMTATDPIVRFRALDAQGEPMRKTTFGVVRATSLSFSGGEVRSDADGRVQFAIQAGWLADGVDHTVLVLARGDGGDVTHYAGALRVPVDERTAGIVDLGDVKFADEPTMVEGVVVDADGKPVPGVVVGTQFSWLHECHSSSWGAGGDRLFFEHKVRTDDQGRFALRELSPKDVRMPLQLEGGDLVLAEDCSAAPGSRSLQLVAVRAGTVRLQMRDDPRRTRVQWILRPTGATGGGIHSFVDGEREVEWRGVVPGRYDVEIDAIGGRVEVAAGIEVKAGEVCADPRLGDVDALAHCRTVRVEVFGPDGVPAKEQELIGVLTTKRGGSSSSSYTGDQGAGTLLFAKAGLITVCVARKDCRTVIVEGPPADLRVDLVERAHVRLRLPEGIALPDGCLVSVHVADAPWWRSRGRGDDGTVEWKNGRDVEVRPDTDGELAVDILAKDRSVLWSGKITVTAGARVDATVPIDAAAAKEVEAAMRDGK